MKWKRAAILALATALVLPDAAFAEAQIEISVRGTAVSIRGNFDEADAKQYVVKVYKPGYSGTASDANNEVYIASLSQGQSSANGALSLKLVLDETLPTGQYLLQVTSSNQRELLEESFNYYAESDLNGILQQFNAATSVSQIQALVEANYEPLEIDFSGSFAKVANKQSIYDRLYALAPYGTLGGVANIFRDLCLLSLIEQASNGTEVNTIMQGNPDTFVMDYTIYAMLPNAVAALAKLTGQRYASVDAFNKAFDEAVGTQAFSDLSRNKMEMLINTYKDYLTLPEDFGSITSTQKLNLYKVLEGVNSFSSFQTVSNFIADNYKTPGGSTGNNSYGGSSNRGPSGSSYSGIGMGNGGVRGISDMDEPPVDDQLSFRPFVDLGTVDWAEEAINYLYQRGIISGVDGTHFEPNRAITREEFVKIIVNTFSLYGDGQAEFSDVDRNSWYAEYLDRAVSSNIIQGMGDGTFGVGTTLTRQDMAVILSRAAAYVGIKLEEELEYATFTDMRQISDYAQSAVQELYCGGIINGMSNDTFAPLDTATRAMAARTIYALLMV